MNLKISFTKFLGFLLLTGIFSVAQAQGVRDIKLHEVLVKNESNCIDNYGVRSGWFEVLNIGYTTADIGGCFVTNDINEPKKYYIPKGNPSTRIAPRAYALFYAYENADRGIYHVNFSLDEKGFLAIFDQSGETLLDSVSYDIAAQKPDISFGKMENIADHAKAEWVPITNPTPEAMNYTVVEETRAEKYRKTDRTGGIITITSMGVVFTLLAFLAVVFIVIGRNFQKRSAKNAKKVVNENQEVQPTPANQADSDAEADLSAIAMALHLYFNDQHEVEPTGFYLNRGLNFQNGWSGKQQLFKQSPIRKR